MMTDVDFAKSGADLPLSNMLSASAGEYQVAEKTECLSIDYIQKVQQSSKTDFSWDPAYTSDNI
jgi:hypothetical protein